MRLVSASVGEHARIDSPRSPKVELRSSASRTGLPSLLASYLSISSSSTTRTGRIDRLVGDPAPASARNPPEKRLNMSVLPARLARWSPIAHQFLQHRGGL